MSKEEFYSNPNIQQDEIRQELESIYAKEALKGAAVEAVFGNDLNVEKILAAGQSIQNKRAEFLRQNSYRRKFGSVIGSNLFKADFERSRTADQDLKERESIIGGSIFGETASGQSRRFYCEDSNRWVYEESRDNGEAVKLTYEVRDEGVLKMSDKPGDVNSFVVDKELDNFRLATESYYQLTSKMVYSDHNLGKRAA